MSVEFVESDYTDRTVGDVVRLKSGGPWMVVEGIEIHTYGAQLNVCYFDGNLLVRHKLREPTIAPRPTAPVDSK